MPRETFALELELGNAAMREPWDVAQALRRVADAVENGAGAGRVGDVNGNTVGTWTVDYPPDDLEEEASS